METTTLAKTQAAEIRALNDFVAGLPEDGVLRGFFTDELFNAFLWTINSHNRIPLPTVIIPKEIAQAIEARNTPQGQYPKWQAKIREAQAQEYADRAEQYAKREADEQKRQIENINHMREVLAGQGLELPESTTGEWVLGNYTFKVNPGHFSSDLNIRKDVPDVDMAFYEANELWDTDYRVMRLYVLEWRFIDSVAIADALDTLDADVIQQIETNQRVIARLTERQSQSDEEPALQAPSLAQQLEAIMRQAQAAMMDIY